MTFTNPLVDLMVEVFREICRRIVFLMPYFWITITDIIFLFNLMSNEGFIIIFRFRLVFFEHGLYTLSRLPGEFGILYFLNKFLASPISSSSNHILPSSDCD